MRNVPDQPEGQQHLLPTQTPQRRVDALLNCKPKFRHNHLVLPDDLWLLQTKEVADYLEGRLKIQMDRVA